MAITLGAEFFFQFHQDTAQTYTRIETALVNAGFSDYTIIRQVNSDGSGDMAVYVRDTTTPLDASETMQSVADALTELDTPE